MVGITMAEILEKVERFNGMLVEFYERLLKQAENDEVRFLAEYMIRHTKRARQAIADLPSETRSWMRHSFLPYEPHIPDCHDLEAASLSPGATLEQAQKAAMELHKPLERLYEQLSRLAIQRDVKEMFESMLNWELGEETCLKTLEV